MIPTYRWILTDYNTGELIGAYRSQSAATREQNRTFKNEGRETEWKRVTYEELEKIWADAQAKARATQSCQ